MKKLSIIFIFSITFTLALQAQESKFTGKTIILKSTNDLSIKADIYDIDDTSAPIILLYHQAGYSRGEYRTIAPKLNELGFMCIAIDQRSGNEVQGVINETAWQAAEKGLPTKYPDAFPDMVSLLKHTIKTYPNRKIIIWGSSYSSTLSFILASKFKNDVSAMLAFSPGEYFTFENKKIEDFAKEVSCPVFITSAKDEEVRWKGIFENIPGNNKTAFVPKADGLHGSKALWPNHENNNEYWDAIKTFLQNLN